MDKKNDESKIKNLENAISKLIKANEKWPDPERTKNISFKQSQLEKIRNSQN